jgi:hypothetical protein
VLIPRDLHIGNPDFEGITDGQEIEFEVVGAQFKQQDRDIIVVGRLRTALKPAALQPLLTAEVPEDIKVVNTDMGSQSEEKTVSIIPVESEKKKTRKLKKPSVTLPNDESVKEGMAEGPIG